MIIFFFIDTPPTEIYTLSLHDALPIWTRSTVGPVTRRRGSKPRWYRSCNVRRNGHPPPDRTAGRATQQEETHQLLFGHGRALRRRDRRQGAAICTSLQAFGPPTASWRCPRRRARSVYRPKRTDSA